MRLFRPNLEEVVIGDKYQEMVDGVLSKDISSVGAYEYEKTFSINGVRYFITFEHNQANHENEFSLHFGLTGISGNPITNAGLEVFGKIVDEMADAYEEILKQEPVDHILISASWDGYSKDEIERVKEIVAKDPSKLNGLEIEQNGYQAFSIKFENGSAIIKSKGQLGVPFIDTIPVSLSLVDDIKHIAKIDVTEYIPDMLNYIKGTLNENKKQMQRLKLYQFYLRKRYPQFTFNSKEVVNESGKKELEFERDEHGQPYLLVTTNNSPTGSSHYT
jgi:hypothetical protein